MIAECLVRRWSVLKISIVVLQSTFLLTRVDAFFGGDSSQSPLWDLGTVSGTYPPAWVEKCGNQEGDIPLFREKADEFKKCFEVQVNMSDIQMEILDAYFGEKVPDFTKKYCRKVPQINECIDQFAKGVEHCLEDERQQDLWTTVKMVKAAIDFVCYRDGERILFFLNSEGIECYHQEGGNLHRCVNETKWEEYTNYTGPGEIGFLASLTYNDKFCTRLRNISQCLYDSLAQCTKEENDKVKANRMPSLLMEGLTKTVLKETPCYVVSAAASSRSRVTSSILISLIFLLLVSLTRKDSL